MNSYVEEIRLVLLCRPEFNWDSIVAAGPLEMSLISCLIAASATPDAQMTKVIPPDGGLKFLRYACVLSAQNAVLMNHVQQKLGEPDSIRHMPDGVLKLLAAVSLRER